MDTKPFYELTMPELAKLEPALLEYQLQEGQLSWTRAAESITGMAGMVGMLREGAGHRDSQEMHNVEWWKTYRAALGGLLAGGKMTVEECHKYSEQAADRAHGPLEKISPE